MSRALVVGAGPTGLTAALTLARHGVTVDVREQNPGLSGTSLAATLHPPTLQILADLGVDLTDTGLIADTIGYRRGDRRLLFSLRDLADLTAFPYRRHVPRLDVCHRILDVLNDLAMVDVRFGCPADPSDRNDYDIVFAADGPHSRWREAACIGFPGQPYDGQVARLVCVPTAFDGWPAVTYVFTDDDSVSVLQLADSTRVILRVGPQEPPLAELLERAMDALGFLPDVTDWSTYRAQRALCDTNLRGTCVIVGDAAHQTNTRGGMNMNAGMHDAAVLARTFATDPDELPVAAAERLRVATEELLPRTHATLGPGRFDDVATIHADPVRRRQFLVEASMLDMVRW